MKEQICIFNVTYTSAITSSTPPFELLVKNYQNQLIKNLSNLSKLSIFRYMLDLIIQMLETITERRLCTTTL